PPRHADGGPQRGSPAARLSARASDGENPRSAAPGPSRTRRGEPDRSVARGLCGHLSPDGGASGRGSGGVGSGGDPGDGAGGATAVRGRQAGVADGAGPGVGAGQVERQPSGGTCPPGGLSAQPPDAPGSSGPVPTWRGVARSWGGLAASGSALFRQIG